MTEDQDQIRRTLAEYCQLLDDGQFDQWADLFTEDARLVLLGKVTTGRDAIRDYMMGVQPDGSRGLHMTANSVVDADGDSATATTDYMFLRPSAPVPPSSPPVTITTAWCATVTAGASPNGGSPCWQRRKSADG